MNFNDALVSMKNRQYVKRPTWEDGYCAIMPGMETIWKILTKPTPNAGLFQQTIADLEADDWELVA